MNPENTLIKHTDFSKIKIIMDITHSDASSIFEVDLDGQTYALKLFHNNGDPRYTEKGRDLNRFRCELNAYEKLFAFGVCERGFVPKFYGSNNQVDPAAFYPAFQHFARDTLKPSAILLEYLPNPECLNCVNYSDTLYTQAIEGMKEIHSAGVHHRDIYPKNLLLVHGNTDRLVWIDFDVATTFTDFGTEQKARSDYEIALVKGLGEALRDDQANGLPPNTKWY
ncbi:kinase-like domain-containing protein [Penicillium herquei]|nr:kinase-like domain-containing protein [Penicillium herquei]